MLRGDLPQMSPSNLAVHSKFRLLPTLDNYIWPPRSQKMLAYRSYCRLTPNPPVRSLCKSNTVRNIETIGLLGGSLSADGSSFNITTLIIPKQKGETDRVEMLKEEEIWEIFFQVLISIVYVAGPAKRAP